MASLFKQYHKALFDAPRIVHVNEALRAADRVYYETRKFKRGPDIFKPETRSTVYQGKLSKESKCMVVGGRDALAGEVIVWECEECPEPPQKVSSKGAHRGVAGILERNVFCKIALSYRSIRQG